MFPWRRPAIRVAATVVALLASGACKDGGKRMEERQKQRNAEKKAQEDAAEAKRKAAMPKEDRAKLDKPWAADDYLELGNGRQCPDGLWALFGDAPGEGAVKTANEAKRDAFGQKMKDATFYAVLRLGPSVELGKYDAKKKVLPVQIDGVVACFDGLGPLSVAVTAPAKPFRLKEDESPVPQSVWRAPPLVVPLSFPTAAKAKEWSTSQGTGLEARLVFRAGKTEVDKKLLKPPKDPEAEAGAPEPEAVDWGAGRLVHAELVGVRVATDHEKVEVAEQLKK